MSIRMVISYYRVVMIVLNLFFSRRAQEHMKHHQYRSASKPGSMELYPTSKELYTLNNPNCLDVCQCRSRLYPEDSLTTTAAVWVEGTKFHLSKRTEPVVESAGPC